MAGSLLWLSFLSLGMFAGSFSAGVLPLSVTFTSERLRLANTFGAGLTVGAALIVIIPEGVATLYSALEGRSDTLLTVHKRATYEESLFGQCRGPGCESVLTKLARRAFSFEELESESDSEDESEDEDREGQPPHNSTKHAVEGHAHGKFSPHSYIGPSLAVGFAFMLLVDQLSKTAPKAQQHHVLSVSDFRAESRTPSPTLSTGSANGRSGAFSATLGMIVHAMADGVALGSSAAISENLEFVVFLAIIVHKAPSSFGLSTFLLSEGISRRAVRQHLLAFSLSAPLTAILTFLFLTTSSTPFVGVPAAIETLDVHKWTGILLLFSGGTFLFVSLVHILPEVYTPAEPEPQLHGNGHLTSQSTPHNHNNHARLSFTQIALLLIGIAIPWLLHVEH